MGKFAGGEAATVIGWWPKPFWMAGDLKTPSWRGICRTRENE
jgi:hypothetical protein